MTSEKNRVKIGDLFPVQHEAPGCFACGPDNPFGMKLRFKKESENSVSTRFRPPKEWTGWGDILHGGFQALLLDEVMSWVPFGLFGLRPFVTKNMNVEFHRPLRIGQELKVIGEMEDDDGRTIRARGEIRGEKNTILTSASAEIVRIDPSRLVVSQANVGGGRI